ncbi:hypothetical protein ACQP2P_08935 [Dactylosporangium sp. CA-139114]|uniref:hypothetical protein n=1 Tax=Dactylosporangium sp. CA-139114 TaxID=3239931 RepID=UPI003D9663FC
MTAPDDEDEALLAELRRVFAALDAPSPGLPPAAAPPAARPPRAARRTPAPPGDASDASGSPDGARPASLDLDAPGRAGRQHRPGQAGGAPLTGGRSLPPVKGAPLPERRPGPPAP